jgi:aminoglycoside 6'-N-acetyltransferase
MRRPVEPVRGKSTVIRRATLDDAEMLVRWHAEPEVARFWDGTTYTREQMLDQLQEPDVDPYVVEVDGQPIGYLQAWFDHDVPAVAGLDMFLVPSARNHGFGPDAARAITEWLLETGGMDEVTVDPYITNDSGVRAWERAGFRRVAKADHDEHHTEPWFVMVFRGQ